MLRYVTEYYGNVANILAIDSLFVFPKEGYKGKRIQFRIKVSATGQTIRSPSSSSRQQPLKAKLVSTFFF
jgi:hypothetical protein